MTIIQIKVAGIQSVYRGKLKVTLKRLQRLDEELDSSRYQVCLQIKEIKFGEEISNPRIYEQLDVIF